MTCEREYINRVNYFWLGPTFPNSLQIYNFFCIYARKNADFVKNLHFFSLDGYA